MVTPSGMVTCRTIFSPKKFLHHHKSANHSFHPVGVFIPDLQVVETLIVLLDVDVDGEMGIDVSHLVLVALGDAGD